MLAQIFIDVFAFHILLMLRELGVSLKCHGLEEHNVIYMCWILPGAGICAEAATRAGCISEENYSAAEDRASHY